MDVTRSKEPQLFALCNVKGRALATGWVMIHQDQTLLVVATTVADDVCAHLNQYGRFSQLAFAISTDRVYVTPSADHTFPITEEIGLCITQDTEETRLDAQKKHLINAGITLVEKESVEKLTPHMLNFPALGGVHFDKGCYLGQEIIARTEHLGQVKRSTYKGRVDGMAPKIMDAIMRDDGTTVGTITMVASNSDDTHNILMVLPQTEGPLHCASGPVTIL